MQVGKITVTANTTMIIVFNIFPALAKMLLNIRCDTGALYLFLVFFQKEPWIVPQKTLWSPNRLAVKCFDRTNS